MQSFLLFFFSISLILSLNYFFIKNNFLLDKQDLPHKLFSSEKRAVPLTGGFLILFNLSFFYDSKYLLFFLFIFILGLLSDLFIIKSPLKKIIIQFLIITLYVIISGLRITSTKIPFIDLLIKNNFFSIIFITFCLLVLINGSNFLDGLNTLIVGYYALIVLVILYLAIQQKINYNFNFFYYLFFTLLIVFVFNFFSRIYLGDMGVYLLSFIIGVELINLSNLNSQPYDQFISPLFIILLLWYPAFENLFSIIRKIFYKINPSEPDNKHLHHLFYFIISKTLKKNNFSNPLSAVIINFYNLLIFLIGMNFYSKTKYLVCMIIINILIYLLFYYFLVRKIELISKKKSI
jgi:UDP-N-acetylmuramyl pentapeptide phosphotransferase/UDP-N-acetylglucosamine-1-phosphate transferase